MKDLIRGLLGRYSGSELVVIAPQKNMSDHPDNIKTINLEDFFLDPEIALR